MQSGLLTKRGFTGHEHIDELELIHMNGRVYDPETGRVHYQIDTKPETLLDRFIRGVRDVISIRKGRGVSATIDIGEQY